MMMDLPSLNNHTKIGSLNCRGLPKSNSTVVKQFIRYLRKNCFLDILTLQETHTHSLEKQQLLTMQFQSKAHIITDSCAILSFNSQIMLETKFISEDGRFIYAAVSHQHNKFPSFNLLNIYCPASYAEKRDFNRKIEEFMNHTGVFNNPDNNILITGDFNYSYNKNPGTYGRTPKWIKKILENFVDCVTPS